MTVKAAIVPIRNRQRSKADLPPIPDLSLPQLLTYEDVAAVLKVSASTVIRLVKAGKLVPRQLHADTSLVRFTPATLLDYMTGLQPIARRDGCVNGHPTIPATEGGALV